MTVLAWEADRYCNKTELIGVFSSIHSALNGTFDNDNYKDQYMEVLINNYGHFIYEDVGIDESYSNGLINNTDNDEFKQLCYQYRYQNILNKCIELFEIETLPDYIELNVPLTVSSNDDPYFFFKEKVYLKSIAYIGANKSFPESFKDHQNWNFEINYDDMEEESEYYEFDEFVQSFHCENNMDKIINALKEVPLHSI